MFSKRSESREATVMGVIYNEFEMNGKKDETTPAARDPLRGEGQANRGTKPHDGGRHTGIMGHGKRYGRWCY
jgi:hypothetical protein